MHPGTVAEANPDKPAYIMAETGQIVTFRELDDTSMQGSQLFRKLGLQRGDHIAILLENHPRFLQICWAAQRSGLYYTAISYRLQEEEVEYIVNDCEARVFITSKAREPVVEKLVGKMPNVERAYMLDGVIAGFESWEEAIAEMPAEPIADQAEGMSMLYSSGTTGKPKGIKKDLPDTEFGADTPNLFALLYAATDDSIYLSPAPLYHSAPLAFNMGMLRSGITCVIMAHFDPERALEFIEKYKVTHSQWVPTMFIRMLKLDEDVRNKYDVSSLQVAIHAAAPCPIQVKEQMIEWWGPVLHEYYAGTEGNGFVAINSEDWLAHKGSVGKPVVGAIHIVDEDTGEEVSAGEVGTIYFEGGGEFEYYNDEEKTRSSRHPRGWSTLGDVGYLDEDGFLYLTDRKSYMIISGGVNIYPQETENLLVTHPKVLDVAVFGVPNEEFGEEVKAVVQPKDFSEAGPELEAELIEFCREHISHIKCPRSVDFEEELPRHPTGKLYKRLLKDRYWQGHKSGIA
ncbi:MAG: acyl-CoA synthetase [Pseudomonadales bacterium]|nr:acyl-CoA synthetase [Pseudomonadales bacterium]